MNRFVEAIASTAQGNVSIFVAPVDNIDTSTNPDLYTVAGRQVPMRDDGVTIVAGDLVLVLVVGSQAVGLGKLRNAA